jgi:hypothetical protein
LNEPSSPVSAKESLGVIFDVFDDVEGDCDEKTLMDLFLGEEGLETFGIAAVVLKARDTEVEESMVNTM